MDWMAAAWKLLYLVPAFPLALAWRELVSTPGRDRLKDLVTLVIGSISLLWIATAFASQDVLGPGYSLIRYRIIFMNLIAVLTCFLYSLVFSFFPAARRRHLLTAGACLLLSLEWLITAAANSAA